MSASKLNKALYTDLTNLRLCNKNDAPVRFLLEKSPFDDDDDGDDSGNQASSDAVEKEYSVIGRIFPKSDIYKDASYKIEMKLTNSFPANPPDVRFLTPIYHPNVLEDGTFCHDLILKTGKWKFNQSLIDVVKTVVDSVENPDYKNPIRANVGIEYMDNRPEFNRKALEMVKNHGLPLT